MARQLFESTLTDQQGHIVVGGSITVYLTGTLTAATIYSASSGGSAVTGSKVTSGSDGSYSFWIDESDYGVDQLFRVTLIWCRPAFQGDAKRRFRFCYKNYR